MLANFLSAYLLSAAPGAPFHSQQDSFISRLGHGSLRALQLSSESPSPSECSRRKLVLPHLELALNVQLEIMIFVVDLVELPDLDMKMLLHLVPGESSYSSTATTCVLQQPRPKRRQQKFQRGMGKTEGLSDA